MPPRKNKQKHIVEKVYKTIIKYHCPVRGLIEEEIEVKRYQSPEIPRESQIEIESLGPEAQEDEA